MYPVAESIYPRNRILQTRHVGCNYDLGCIRQSTLSFLDYILNFVAILENASPV